MRIGIWEHNPNGDRYERVDGEWPNWSDSAGFTRVPDRRRVLLLGESVARGLLYEPLVTPALMIEQALDAAAPGQAEVVDLARSGARFQDLLDLAESARDLAPDAVVVFAGNNWKYELTEWASKSQQADEARALEQGGVAELLRERESRLANAVTDFVNRICDLFAGQAPVLFVLPESNLLDWHTVPLVPVLGDGGDSEWHRVMRRTRQQMRDGDEAAVLAGCEQLHRLDGGVSEEPYRYRARIHLARGESDEALANYRHARDVRLWCDGIDPSWLPSIGVTAARTAAVSRGAAVVDLTATLPAQCASGIPDRTVFADFCHLNGQGLVFAATEIACALGPVLGLNVTPELCARTLRVPAPEVEAGAAFSAAFVNADFAQPSEVISFYARLAAHAAPQIVGAMEAYCAAPAAPTPWWMRTIDIPKFANAERCLRGIGRVGRYLYDDALVRSFTAEINAARGRPDDDPPVRSHAALVPGVRANLHDPTLAPAWRPLDWEGLLDTLPGRPTGYRHYFRAHTEESRFLFIAAEPVVVHVEITMRLGTPGEGTTQVLVNEHEVGSFELGDRWHLCRFSVPAEQVETGRNELVIRWRRSLIETTPLPILARRIEQGLGQELAIVFGEVHSVHATVA